MPDHVEAWKDCRKIRGTEGVVGDGIAMHYTQDNVRLGRTQDQISYLDETVG